MVKIYLNLLLVLSNILYGGLIWDEFLKEYEKTIKECDIEKLSKLENEYYQKALNAINKKEEKYFVSAILTISFFDNLKTCKFEEAKNALKKLEDLALKYKFLRVPYKKKKHHFEIGFYFYNKKFEDVCQHWRRWKDDLKKNYAVIGYIIKSAIIINDKEILSEMLKLKIPKDFDRAIIKYFLSNGDIKPNKIEGIIYDKDLYNYLIGKIDKNRLIENLKNIGYCPDVYKCQYDCLKLFYQSLP